MKSTASASNTFPFLKWASWIYLLGMFFFTSLVYSDDVLDRTLLPRFACAVVILSVVSFLLLFTKKNIEWPSISFPLGALALFFLWNVQSLFWVDTFSEALFESQRVLLMLSVFWLTLVFIKNDPNFEKKILYVAIVLGGIAVVVGGYQLFQVEEINKLSLYEVKGISGHRNLFGALLFLLLGLSVLASISLKKSWQWLARGIVFCLLVLLLLLQARSAWVGCLVALFIFILFFLFSKKEKKILAWPIFGGLLLALVLAMGWNAWQGGLSAFIERLNIANYLGSETAVERLRLWDKTICTFWQSPITGVGAGNWQTHFAGCGVHGLYSIELNNVTYQRPHNDFLWVLSENGIIGFVLFLSFVFGILFRAVAKLAKVEEVIRLKIIVLISIIIGFLVIACFSFPKERIELLIWSTSLYALLYTQGSNKKIRSHLKVFVSKILLILFLSGGLFSGYSLWKRAVGEYEMNQIYFLKAGQKWDLLLKAVNIGESPFYRLDPNAIPMKWYEGTAHFSLGKYDLAKSNFEEALLIAPYSQHCWNDLGSANEKLGDREQAIKCYYKSLVISPLFDDPQLNLGILFYKNGDFVRAKELVQSLRDTIRAQPYLEAIDTAINQKSK